MRRHSTCLHKALIRERASHHLRRGKQALCDISTENDADINSRTPLSNLYTPLSRATKIAALPQLAPLAAGASGTAASLHPANTQISAKTNPPICSQRTRHEREHPLRCSLTKIHQSLRCVSFALVHQRVPHDTDPSGKV